MKIEFALISLLNVFCFIFASAGLGAWSTLGAVLLTHFIQDEKEGFHSPLVAGSGLRARLKLPRGWANDGAEQASLGRRG